VGAAPSGRIAARKATARKQPSPVARRATVPEIIEALWNSKGVFLLPEL